MKLLGLTFLSLLLVTACNSNEPAETKETIHDTVVVKEKETETIREQAPAKEEPKKEPVEPAAKPWADKMARFHELNCKINKGGATVSDRVDQGVLLKDLNTIRDRLNKDERFYFNADLVKANDMSTCPK